MIRCILFYCIIAQPDTICNNIIIAIAKPRVQSTVYPCCQWFRQIVPRNLYFKNRAKLVVAIAVGAPGGRIGRLSRFRILTIPGHGRE